MHTWFEYVQRCQSSALRLFGFPHAGGNAAVFADWQRRLGIPIEVYPIEMPGRNRRIKEPVCRDLMTLSSSVADALTSLLSEPYVLFGHSMGALLSFEVARLLKTRFGSSPLLLIVAGANAPDRQKSMRTFALPDDEFHAELRKLDGTSPAVFERPDLLGLISPIIRADIEAVQTYRFEPGVLLSCPILVLGGSEDPETAESDLVRWQAHTTGPTSLRMFRGGHFFLNSRTEEFFASVRAAVSPLAQASQRRSCRQNGEVGPARHDIQSNVSEK